MRVALYLRVSTDVQNYDNQKNQLVEYCKNKGYDIVATYEEAAHGNYPEARRPEFLRLMDDAARRKFDAILVWALDRFTREGVSKTHLYITRLEEAGIHFVSYQEPYLNTSEDNPFREVVLSLMAYMAKQERIRISERTKASLERMRKEIEEKGYAMTKDGRKVASVGKKLSYPPEKLAEIRTLWDTKDHEGNYLTTYRISKLTGLNHGSIVYAIEKLLKLKPTDHSSTIPPGNNTSQEVAT